MIVIRISKIWLKMIVAAICIFVTCVILSISPLSTDGRNVLKRQGAIKKKYSVLSELPQSTLDQLLSHHDKLPFQQIEKSKLQQNNKSQHKHDTSVIISQKNHGPRLFKNIPSIQRTGNYLDDLAVVTTVTASFIDFAENWLASIKRLPGDHPGIYIIAEDQETYDYFQKKSPMANVHVLKAPQFEINSTLIFDTTEYKNFVNKRPHYILDILKRGYDVLFSDVDIVWMDAPYPFFQDTYDIHILEDQGPPKPTIYCAGFVMYKATNATIQFVERWIKEINHFREPRPDQMLLNLLLQNRTVINRPVPKISFNVFDTHQFISGRHYFNKTWRRDNPSFKPVVLHNNWIKGHDIKVERFQELGMWFV